MLVFQLSKQQNLYSDNLLNRTRNPSENRTQTKKFPLEELGGGCFLSWVLNWESTENWDFHRLEPYTNPYSDTSWNFGCGFFAYSWKLPAYSGAFLLTVDKFSFFTYSWSFFAYNFSFLTYSWGFFAYSGKARLIRALRDCKQRSLTVSKKAPTVSKKASPWNFLK